MTRPTRLTDAEVARVKRLATDDLYFADDAPSAYPRPLDERLARWYVYVSDSGHCLLILSLDVLASHNARGATTPEELAALLVPAPVRAVLRSTWREREDGFIACDLPYDLALGLVTRPEDEEFDGFDG